MKKRDILVALTLPAFLFLFIIAWTLMMIGERKEKKDEKEV